MLQNAKVIAFSVYELLTEKKQGGVKLQPNKLNKFFTIFPQFNGLFS